MPVIERDDRQDRERLKAVEIAVGQIEKQFGKGSIMRLGQKGAIQPIDFIPTGAVSKYNTCLIFINQRRENIDVMFGDSATTTSVRALKFYSSVRMDIRRIASIKDGDAVVGGRTRVKVVKNKVAPPFREAEFDVMYGEGISKTGDLLDLAVDKRIVEKSGAWFAYGGERLGQGRENAKQFLKDNPDVHKTIEDRVRRELGMSREAPEAAAV